MWQRWSRSVSEIYTAIKEEKKLASPDGTLNISILKQQQAQSTIPTAVFCIESSKAKTPEQQTTYMSHV